MIMMFELSRLEPARFERQKIARDLRKDLKQLKRNGVDPKMFLRGKIYRLARMFEE